MDFLLEIGVAETLGILAFISHISAYLIYTYYIFKEDIRPNAASWFMWLIGGWVEYITYDALGESHWSTSALPLACVIGLTIILSATIFLQIKNRLAKEGKRICYHAPEKGDYYLTGFDISALLIWIYSHAAAFANILAVSTSIISFIPIWKTTYQTGEERATPWALWVFAYICMTGAVLIEGGLDIAYKLFYPIYYLFLHIVVLLLCFKQVRNFIATKIMLKRSS